MTQLRDEFDGGRTPGELGRSIDRLSATVEKLDGTVDRLRDDTVSRREFDDFKRDIRGEVAKNAEGITWFRRVGIAGPVFGVVTYVLYRLFNASGVGA